MSEDIKEVANSFRTFERMYDDVMVKGIESIDFCLDNQDNKWKRIELMWMLGHFVNKEEYEKCTVIRDLMSNHFVADENKQKELNDRMDKLLNQNKDE